MKTSDLSSQLQSISGRMCIRRKAKMIKRFHKTKKQTKNFKKSSVKQEREQLPERTAKEKSLSSPNRLSTKRSLLICFFKSSCPSQKCRSESKTPINRLLKVMKNQNHKAKQLPINYKREITSIHQKEFPEM